MGHTMVLGKWHLMPALWALSIKGGQVGAGGTMARLFAALYSLV
jgi:hypothetical protein